MSTWLEQNQEAEATKATNPTCLGLCSFEDGILHTATARMLLYEDESTVFNGPSVHRGKVVGFDLLQRYPRSR